MQGELLCNTVGISGCEISGMILCCGVKRYRRFYFSFESERCVSPATQLNIAEDVNSFRV
jgi:hypothetical protein